jgi:hypothetical protein
MIFYESEEERWSAIQKDMKANSAGESRLADIQASMDGKDFAPTNTVWEYTTGMLPQLIWTNPKVEVESAIPGQARYNSIGQKYAIEALMKMQNWDQLWEQVFTDALAWRGVTMVTTEKSHAPRYMDGIPLKNWEGKEEKIDRKTMLTYPRMVYIHPTDFFCDSEMRTRAAARRMGHRWTDSRGHLKKVAAGDPTWNSDVLNAHGAVKKGTSDKDLVTIYQLFVPSYLDPKAIDGYTGDEEPGKDDLHTGTLYTMMEGSDVRPPRVYRGPAQGPYEVYECVPQAGRRDRVAPLAAVWPQIDQDARVGEALTAAGESYKRVAFMTDEMATAFSDNEHDGVVSVGLAPEILQQALVEAEIGGPSEQLIRAKMITAADKDRSLSMSDTGRGFAASDTTATAEDLAATSAAIRVGLIRSGLQRSAERQISVAFWHIEHNEDFVIGVPQEARVKGLEMLREGGMPIPPGMENADDGSVIVWTGGDALGVDPVSPFDAQTVTIQVMSMEKVSEGLQARRILQSGELMQRALEMKTNFPGFKAKDYVEDAGAMLNIPGLGKYMPDEAEQGAAAQGAPGAPGVPGTEGVPGNMSGANTTGALQ